MFFKNQDFYDYCSAALAPKCFIFSTSWRQLMQFYCSSSSVETRAPNPPRLFWGKCSRMVTFKTLFHHQQHFHVASCDLTGEGSYDTIPLTPGGKHTCFHPHVQFSKPFLGDGRGGGGGKGENCPAVTQQVEG